MLKLVRNSDDAVTPNTTTAASASTRPYSQRTSPCSRSRSSSAKVGPPPAQRGRQPQRDAAVQRDRAEQQGAGDCLVPEARDAEHVAHVQARIQQKGAERGTDDASAAAEDRHPADD